MPRPNDNERYEFSDGEKRGLIKLIGKGEPLPEKYRFLLFADKREVELVWNGKTREVCTVKVIDIFGNDTMTLVPVTAG
jgi:site-specific DNA-methyltransferase (adenine-specific)/adenine-specific DNA-methyltransferase